MHGDELVSTGQRKFYTHVVWWHVKYIFVLHETNKRKQQ